MLSSRFSHKDAAIIGHSSPLSCSCCTFFHPDGVGSRKPAEIDFSKAGRNGCGDLRYPGSAVAPRFLPSILPLSSLLLSCGVRQSNQSFQLFFSAPSKKDTGRCTSGFSATRTTPSQVSGLSNHVIVAAQRTEKWPSSCIRISQGVP